MKSSLRLSLYVVVLSIAVVLGLSLYTSMTEAGGESLTKYDYLQWVGREVHLTWACSYYDSKYAATADVNVLSSAEKSIEWFNKKFVIGEGYWEALADYSAEEPVYVEKEECYTEYVYENKTNETIGEQEICFNITTQSGTRAVTRQRWEPYEWDRNAKHLRFCARLKIVLGSRSIEHVPVMFGYEFREYDWWNDSYKYRYPIQSYATSAGILININDTYAPNIWTLNATSGEKKYLYCENTGCTSGSVAIGNETNETAWENGTARMGDNPTDLYSQNVLFRLHVDELNGSLAYDSGKFNNTFSYSDSPTKTRANSIWDGALDFDGTNDYIYKTGIQTNTEGTISFWIYPKEYTSYHYLTKEDGLPWATRDFYINVEGQNGSHWGYQFVTVNTDNAAYCIVARGNPYYPLTAYEWNYVVAVYNSSGCFVYVNGVIDANITNPTGTKKTSTYKFWWAARTDGKNINATFDEMIYENRSWGNQEVLEHYYNGIDNLTWLGAMQAVDNATESDGRKAIVEGIEDPDALGSSAEIHTDQHIYLRHANGSQQNGTFDKVAVKGNQTWAFNYIAPTDNTNPEVNMNNLSNVVYIWQQANLTTSEIKSAVKGLINSTKS